MKRVTVSERFLLPGPNPGSIISHSTCTTHTGLPYSAENKPLVTALVGGEGKKTYS